MRNPANSSNSSHKSANGNINIGSNGNNTSNSRLLIQCGGYENLEATTRILKRIAHLDQFKEYFRHWKRPWYFAKPHLRLFLDEVKKVAARPKHLRY